MFSVPKYYYLEFVVIFQQGATQREDRAVPPSSLPSVSCQPHRNIESCFQHAIAMSLTIINKPGKGLNNSCQNYS